jgi:hypothetical protein
MPWKNVLCPDGKLKDFDECLACERECFDLEIREALFERERYWQAIEHTGDRISVTALLGCLRATYLERITDFSATPESKWWSLRGELIHRLVERPDMDNPYLRRSEMRLRAAVNGYVVSGQLDNYKLRFLEQGILKDWKSVGDTGLHYIVYDGAKEDHIWQTNIYAWIARENGYRVDRIEIAYLSLMQVVKTGQVVPLVEFLTNAPPKGGKRKNMIGTPRLIRTYPSGKKKWECFYRIPEVPMYDDKTILDFVTPRLACLSQAFKSKIMPPVADEETRRWKCDGYCQVRQQCEAYEASQRRTLDIPC